ncbi:MAG: MFS transporter [Gemmobacter sp.]|uniref:MFS transporter n=1 Tax=Gemmobacter sp. TaxID=1898957 RepID=UPI001A599B40|nr:MFS transporter [Gemmobacter sp.]MBL8562793.1 MFS transporter [Gemmobacter sp.]
MTAAPLAPSPTFPRWSLFAAMLAAAGLPIYIHAPAVYAAQHGLSLAALGLVLAALRLVDVVQDPALGWLAGRVPRKPSVAVALAVMTAAMLGLFAVTPPVSPLIWFALMLTALFTAWSFLTIVFYAEGTTAAGTAHLQLAGWREAGAGLGVCLASVAPFALVPLTAAPYAGFAIGFALLALGAGLAMHGQWRCGRLAPQGGLREVLAQPALRGLLVLALVNAMPAAVSSTLFLFFVQSQLEAPGAEGPLLLLFFAAAALGAPVWTALARRHGTRPALLAAMALAILAFVFTLTLGPGDVLPFAVISAVSGFATGADLALLPALFARQTVQHKTPEAAGFALWSVVSKASLALAAVALLPLLEAQGFAPGMQNPPAALALAYGALPCVLKLAAIALLLRLELTEEEAHA